MDGQSDLRTVVRFQPASHGGISHIEYYLDDYCQTIEDEVN